MKKINKIISVFMALVIVMALASPAAAQESNGINLFSKFITKRTFALLFDDDYSGDVFNNHSFAFKLSDDAKEITSYSEKAKVDNINYRFIFDGNNYYEFIGRFRINLDKVSEVMNSVYYSFLAFDLTSISNINELQTLFCNIDSEKINLLMSAEKETVSYGGIDEVVSEKVVPNPDVIAGKIINEAKQSNIDISGFEGKTSEELIEMSKTLMSDNEQVQYYVAFYNCCNFVLYYNNDDLLDIEGQVVDKETLKSQNINISLIDDNTYGPTLSTDVSENEFDNPLFYIDVTLFIIMFVKLQALFINGYA